MPLLLLVLLPLLLVLLLLVLLLPLLVLLLLPLLLLELLALLLELATGGSLLVVLPPPQADSTDTMDNMLTIAIRRTIVMIPPFNSHR